MELPVLFMLNRRQNVRSIADQHSAAASFAGFLYQLDLALLALAGSETDGHVGLETLDDVVTRTAAGATTVGQSKLSYGRNPLPDRSVNLWKTLSIWLRLVENDECDLEQTEFHLISNHEITGGVVGDLKTTPPAERGKIARRLRALAKNAKGEIKPFTSPILSCSDALLDEFVGRLRVFDRLSSSPIEQAAILAAKLNLASELASPVIKGLRGWIHDRVETKFAAREPAWLNVEDFRREFANLVDRHHDRRFVLRTVEEILITEADRRAQHGAIFVEQLRWIGIADESEDMLDALNDYLRGRAERTLLAEKNNVSKSAFRGFEENLVKHWRRVHGRISEELAADPERAGRNTLRETVDRQQYLDGQPVTEDYLTCGTYHELANTRKARVGWHPQFNDHLTALGRAKADAHDRV